MIPHNKDQQVVISSVCVKSTVALAFIPRLLCDPHAGVVSNSPHLSASSGHSHGMVNGQKSLELCSHSPDGRQPSPLTSPLLNDACSVRTDDEDEVRRKVCHRFTVCLLVASVQDLVVQVVLRSCCQILRIAQPRLPKYISSEREAAICSKLALRNRLDRQ